MFPKQLFYLTSEQLQAWQWHRGVLSAPVVFAATRAGVEEFRAYLQENSTPPAYLVVDVIEEDFTRHLMPHVGGKPGRSLRQRRLFQQYRESPFRTALVQGRSDEGRRDDIVLLTALTNPALLTPWLDAMEAAHAPLAGVYSATLLAPALLDKLELQRRNLLLVTMQSGGLRQTYLRDGQLKFSRLVQPTEGTGVAAAIEPETRRTQQFLTSVRLLERDEMLDVLVLMPAGVVEQLGRVCENGPHTTFHFVPLDAAAAALQMDAVPSRADEVLLYLLARGEPDSHYPLGERGGDYLLWRQRLSLYASSAVLGAVCVAWTVTNLVGYNVAEGNARGLRSETAHYQAAYRNSMSSMPPALDKTANMKAAVQIERMVAQQGPWPLHMLTMVSDALEQSPQIQLTALEWRATVPGAPTETAPGAGPGSPTLVAPTSSLALGIPKAPPQTLRLQAEVLAGKDNYRTVLISMNAFAQRLAGLPRVTVEIAELPFDIRPNAKLSGSVGRAGTAESRARFTLDLVWTP